ncbi:MAG: hypothetical protein ACTH1Z_01270 [Ancrocorticia sp.]
MMTMKINTTIHRVGLGFLTALALVACSQAGDGAAAEDGQVTESAESGMQDVHLGDVAVSIPAEWVPTPESENTELWPEGFDDAESDPAIRIRVAPYTMDTPHPDVVESALALQANYEGTYGDEWERGERSKEDIPGAFRSLTADFTYVGDDDADMVGRWWFMTDPDTYEVWTLEISGEADVLTDDLLEEIDESVEFDPQD